MLLQCRVLALNQRENEIPECVYEAAFFAAAAFRARYTFQRFLVASAIRLRAAVLIPDRFGVDSLETRTAAQRFRCAAAIRSLAAVLRFLFAGDPLVTTAEPRTRPALPPSWRRISATLDWI